MKRNTVARLLAPSFPILLLLCLCLYGLMGPVETIDGKIDNDPKRAAMLIILITPIFIYPGLMLMFAAMVKIAKSIEGKVNKNFFTAYLLVTTIFSLIGGKVMYRPEFDESFLIAWAIVFGVLSLVLGSMLWVWRLMRKRF